ncbi:MAG: hypothetical protein M3Q19_03775 [Pseudomonadota bacterium]|nr:hypothetical protein [Pseudomonadota bacterium]
MIIAMVAVVALVKGGSADRSQALIAVAIMFGAGALLGMALLAWPHRQKDKNDPRS